MKIKKLIIKPKVAILSLFLALVFVSCADEKIKAPDVSNIKVNLSIERFDRDVFSMDTLDIEKSLSDLYVKYPSLYPIFMQNILGFDLPDEILPLSNIPGLVPPFFLNPNQVFALS